MIFIATTPANLLSVFLLSLTERDKYKRTKSALFQVFIINVVIFLLMVPVYFITTSINIGVTAYAVALHIVIAAQVSALILEIVSNYKYSIVGLYGVTLSVLVSAGVMFAMYGLTGEIGAIIPPAIAARAQPIPITVNDNQETSIPYKLAAAGS